MRGGGTDEGPESGGARGGVEGYFDHASECGGDDTDSNSEEEQKKGFLAPAYLEVDYNGDWDCQEWDIGYDVDRADYKERTIAIRAFTWILLVQQRRGSAQRWGYLLPGTG